MHVLIVDDEPLGRDRLVRLVQEHQPNWQISTAAEVITAESIWTSASPTISVVLLDIEMPGENGLAWLGRLKASTEPPAVILTTAWSEYALPAIQQGADGYLLKPVKAQALMSALGQAQKRNRLQAQTRTRVALNLDGSGQYIDLDTLQFCAAESRWVQVRTDTGEFISDRPLKQWETEFGHCLVRVHRSYLVHQNAVVELRRKEGQYVLTTRNGSTLPVSRRHVKEVRSRLTQKQRFTPR